MQIQSYRGDEQGRSCRHGRGEEHGREGSSPWVLGVAGGEEFQSRTSRTAAASQRRAGPAARKSGRSRGGAEEEHNRRRRVDDEQARWRERRRRAGEEQRRSRTGGGESMTSKTGGTRVGDEQGTSLDEQDRRAGGRGPAAGTTKSCAGTSEWRCAPS